MLDALLIDYGGVLTTDVFASFATFCMREGLPREAVRDLFRHDHRGRDLLAGLETGTLGEPEFERQVAVLLGVAAPRLIERLFGAMEPDEAMLAAVAGARRGGIHTGLVSNSWGSGTGYARQRFTELFDAVVISGEVGLRKPDPAIYTLAAQRLGVAAERIAFVDDIGGNLKPARALGMTTVLHRDAATTIRELERLFGLPLA
jgi:epoxide hydrolase-like predicted phosphatase